MRTHSELSLITHFQDLPDPRTKREPEHQLIDLLVIAVCSLRCGGEGFNDMEDFGEAKHNGRKTFLELPGGIPSHDTFNRLFQALAPKSFLACFVRWTQRLRAAGSEEIVALDGKARCRARRSGESAPVLVSAWAWWWRGGRRERTPPRWSDVIIYRAGPWGPNASPAPCAGTGVWRTSATGGSM